MAFLRNHKDDIAAMDLFTVPTASLRLLYGFFVIEHGRRHIVHFNATFHPTSAWVIQQLREAFPYDTAPKYLIFDRDFIFSAAVIEFIKATGTKPIRTSFRSPWQNGTAERWVGSCRRELLEHVVVLGACHLIRLVRAYISYYHEDRCLCIVKTAPPTKSRTYAPLEFRAEDGETPLLCSTLLSSSSHLASVPFWRCVGAAPTWCWRTSLCGCAFYLFIRAHGT